MNKYWVFVSSFTALVFSNLLRGVVVDMGGGNCAFFGYPTSGKHKLSLFRVPSVSASDGEHSKELKRNAREEWLRLVLRTPEKRRQN